MPVELTQNTTERITALFPEDQHAEVGALLVDQCGDNLPFYENATPESCERIRYAVLKLSKGDVSELRRAIDIANCDWRDALVAAGFGHDPVAHEAWMPDTRH